VNREDTPAELHAVLLAGGAGTRCWPESRLERPKQLLPIGSRDPLLLAAWERLRHILPPERIWVSTGPSLVESVQQLLPELLRERLLVEPVGRGTGPALGLAASRLHRELPDCVLAALPADHLIAPVDGFCRVLQDAARRALADHAPIVLFGITPTWAAVGYGYIQRGEPAPDAPERFYQVSAFHEKPDQDTARSYYLAGGGTYTWNGGIFVARPGRYLDALEQFAPSIHRGLTDNFSGIPTQAIDHAVMEPASRTPGTLEVRVVGDEFAWSDVGTWGALLHPPVPMDAHGNHLEGPVLALDCRRCVIRADPEQPGLVAALGLEDLVVVQKGDVLMVLPARRAEEVARIRQAVEHLGRGDLL
jgi:mannose-1-phosphate guanylyltransferase